MRKAADGNYRGTTMVQAKPQFYEALFAGAANETIEDGHTPGQLVTSVRTAVGRVLLASRAA